MKNGELQHLNPWQKVALFFLALFLGLTFSSIINQVLGAFLLNSNEPFDVMGDLTRIDGIRMLKIGNLIVHLVTFIAPVVVLAKAFNFDPKEATLLKAPNSTYWLTIPILFILLTILNRQFFLINHQLDISFISNSAQESLIYQQAVQDKTVYAYIGGTWKSYFTNLFLLALVPAISEELLFRGLIQNLFSKATKNVWAGVSISAFLFALIHWQPLNFLPLFALAFCYGIIAVYTGSLWITMLLHFMNNLFTLSLEQFHKMYGWDFTIPDYLTWLLFLGCFGIIFALVRTNKLQSKWFETKGIYLR